jgi:hypothetical protein
MHLGPTTVLDFSSSNEYEGRHERTHSWAQVEHGRMSQILIPWHVGHSWSLGEQINYRAYNVWNPSISNSPISAMPSV